MKPYLSLSICLLIFGKTNAQSRQVDLSGIVKDSVQPLYGANVSLRAITDSTLLIGTSTDMQGHYFLANIKNGNYLLMVDFFGYQRFKKVITVTDSLKLNDILLVPDKRTLKEVNVIAQKPLITTQLDKTVINIENSIYKNGENGFQLFNVIPGVQSDNTGNINFRGTQSVQVYVDGRQVQLTGVQLMNYLKSIPSESIKSIELSAVPSSEYSAQNNGAILNIVLKSDYKYGLTGTVFSNFEQNRYPNYRGGIILNYRIGKFNIQTNYTYFTAKTFADDIQSQTDHTTEAFTKQSENFVQKLNVNNFKVRVDYNITERQTISSSYEWNNNSGNTYGTGTNSFSSNGTTSATDSSTRTQNNKHLSLTNQLFTVYYINKFDDLGSKLNIGYNYINYNNLVTSDVISNYFLGDGTISRPGSQLFIYNPLSIPISTLSADLDKAFKNKLHIKSGIKYDYSTTNDNNQYFAGPERIADNQESNDFIYKEEILGLYALVTQDFKKWAFNVGLRAEHTFYSGKVSNTADQIDRNQWDLFPTLFLQDKIDNSNNLTFSYAKRIARPSYQLLNPFQDIANPYYITKGNPELQPYYYHTFELTYNYLGMYSVTAGYKITNGLINNVYIQDGNNFISTYDNIDDEREFYMTLFTPFKIEKWWNINFFSYLGYKTITVEKIDPGKFSKFTPYLSLTNRFTLPSRFYLEATAFYLGKSFYSIYDQRPQEAINFSLKKSFFHNKLTATLTATDPFNLKRIQVDVNETNYDRHIQNFLATRTESVGLTYNFSRGKKSIKKENLDMPGQDQLNRLNKP